MPSNARLELSTRLKDVDELVAAHAALTGGGRGRPAQRQGAAITRAGVVLLSAATEAYVEDLFEEAAQLIFNGMPADDLDRLFKNTSKRLNNADVHKTELLYFNLGMPWALRDLSWRKFTNDTLRRELNKLIETRGGIAHGRPSTVRLQTLRRWKNMIEMFAPRVEEKVAVHVERRTGHRPSW
jgi:hypothetical protein